MKHLKFGVGQAFKYTDTQGKTHSWEVTMIADEGKMCRAKCICGTLGNWETGFIIQDGEIIN